MQSLNLCFSPPLDPRAINNMKITATIGPDGKLKREIDFQGARLPDGRSIQDIMDENGVLKEKVSILQKKINETASILVRLIPNRTIRSFVEVVSIIGTIIGIVLLF